MRVILVKRITTAVDDIDKKAPTNIPSEALAPHNYTWNTDSHQLISYKVIHFIATKGEFLHLPPLFQEIRSYEYVILRIFCSKLAIYGKVGEGDNFFSKLHEMCVGNTQGLVSPFPNSSQQFSL